MIYNITKENILNDYAKVAGWVSGELEHQQKTDEYKEIISRVLLFGKTSPLELCRMVIGENFRVLRSMINDLSPFLDVVAQENPKGLERYINYYDFDYEDRDEMLISLYPKYIEKIDLTLDEDGYHDLSLMEQGHWRLLLKLDMSILPFAINTGFKVTRDSTLFVIETQIRKIYESEMFDYELVKPMIHMFHQYDAARLMNEYPEQVDVISKILQLEANFVFTPIESITAYKTQRDTHLYTYKTDAKSANISFTKTKISESVAKASFSDKDKEVIKKYLGLIEK